MQITVNYWTLLPMQFHTITLQRRLPLSMPVMITFKPIAVASMVPAHLSPHKRDRKSRTDKAIKIDSAKNAILQRCTLYPQLNDINILPEFDETLLY